MWEGLWREGKGSPSRWSCLLQGMRGSVMLNICEAHKLRSVRTLAMTPYPQITKITHLAVGDEHHQLGVLAAEHNAIVAVRTDGTAPDHDLDLYSSST